MWEPSLTGKGSSASVYSSARMKCTWLRVGPSALVGETRLVRSSCTSAVAARTEAKTGPPSASSNVTSTLPQLANDPQLPGGRSGFAGVFVFANVRCTTSESSHASSSSGVVMKMPGGPGGTTGELSLLLVQA